MARITYAGCDYETRPDETVLSALQRQGADVLFSCGNGSCGVCMLRCASGTLPSRAKAGVKAELGIAGYFLPCVCVPISDMAIESPRSDDFSIRAEIVAVSDLSPTVRSVELVPHVKFSYRAGQYIRLFDEQGNVRNYSLASIIEDDASLTIHVRRVEGGVVSSWIHSALAVGDTVTFQGPFGSNFYRRMNLDNNLLLIASGTGLAPLFGIARQALAAGHRGRIDLYHSAISSEEHYLNSTLRALEDRNKQFRYCAHLENHRSTSQCSRPGGDGTVASRAFSEVEDVTRSDIHVAGNRKVVDDCLNIAHAFGVRADQILVDPFEDRASGSEGSAIQESRSVAEHGPKEFSPDPEMWAALGHGRLLSRILDDFYSQVFQDELLAPYFRRVTKERLVEKVYAYFRQVFTGERTYFGDRPRNAHHWMVIDDDLFDYRAELLEQVLITYDLPGGLIRRWQRIEEAFRRDIVKDRPWGRLIDGKEIATERYDEATLEYATMCDGCGDEIERGQRVRYHARLGETYGPCCRSCA